MELANCVIEQWNGLGRVCACVSVCECEHDCIRVYVHVYIQTTTLPNPFHCFVTLSGYSQTFRILVPIELNTVLNSHDSPSQCSGLRPSLVPRRLPGFRFQLSLALFLPHMTRPKPIHQSATLSGHSQTSRIPVPI